MSLLLSVPSSREATIISRNLALIGDVFADQQVLHHLLGDGRTAFRPPRIGKIADEGADDAAFVDAVVLVEPLILRGDKRLLHELGNVGDRDPDTAIAGLEHIGKILAFSVTHLAHGRQLLALQLRSIRQVASRIVEKVDDLAEIDHGLVDALILAELVIGGVEVGEIDAVEDCGVGADRLGVVKRGGDQFVDIDRFDVEGLAHMGAAVAQDLHHRA